MDGKGHQSGVPGHAGLESQVFDEIAEIQEGVRRGDEQHPHRHQAAQDGMSRDSLDQVGGNVGPAALHLVQHPVEVDHRKGGQERKDVDLGGQGQPQHQPQDGGVAKAATPRLKTHSEHRPKAGQREKDGECFRPVEMAVLDVDDGQRREAGRQKADRRSVEAAAQQVYEEHRSGVDQGRQGAGNEPHVHGVHVGEHFGHRTEEDQDVDENAAQGEPMGVQRTALGIQQSADPRQPRLGGRLVAHVTAAAVTGSFGQ